MDLYSIGFGAFMTLLAVLSFDTVGSWYNNDKEGVALNVNLSAYLAAVFALGSTLGLTTTRGVMLLLAVTVAYYTVKRAIEKNF
jgi:hypothetical protein